MKLPSKVQSDSAPWNTTKNPIAPKPVRWHVVAYLINLARLSNYLETADRRFNRIMLRALGKS